VLDQLGVAARKRGEYERAREYYRQSLDIFIDIGDRRGEVDKLNQLTTVARRRRNFDAAKEFLERASDQGDTDRAREWLIQAREHLDDAPEELVAGHHERIGRLRTELNS